MSSFDVVVIGAGPGGYVAAIRAAQLGLKTAIIEKEHLGGVCLNWGCIPTKALLRSAEIKLMIDHAKDFGLETGPVKFDIKNIVERSRKISAQLAGGVQMLLKKNKVTVYNGRACLAGDQSVSITHEGKEEKIHGKHIILATGARARHLPSIDVDGKIIWTARHAMIPEKFPKSLLVIGSGAIGIEFASFYRTLGSEVTVVEMQNRILPQEDEEISRLAQKHFENQGIKFHLLSTVSSLKAEENKAHAVIKRADNKEEKLIFDNAILAVGIVGNTEDLGLEKTKVKVEKGQIQIDEWGQTDEPGVYAIGDVAGAPWLAHKASHEGVICVEKIAGIPGVHPLNRKNIPSCTYSLPQIASVGLTEAKAKEAGYSIKVGKFPYIGNGKALALGEPEGLIKTIFDANSGELLGAHMIGAEVTELIHSYTLARTLETTEAELIHTIFPHPTLSEMLHESVLGAYGRSIHI